MTPRRIKQNHLTLYRRHAASCAIRAPRDLDHCECPLWVHGNLRGEFVRKGLDTRVLYEGARKREELLAEAQNPTPEPTAPAPITGIHVAGAPPTTGEPAGDIPLADAMKLFLDDRDRSATNTKKLYKRACDHFLAWAESNNLTHLKQIGQPQIKAYFAQYADGWKRNTRQSRLTHLRVFFNFCKEPEEGRNWIQFSPAASKKLNYAKPDGKSSSRRPFSKEEVTRIVCAVSELPEHLRPRARALVLLMLFTGMRISDATFFRRDYVKADNGCTYWIIKTRKELDAIIWLRPELMEALNALPEIGPYYFQHGEHEEAHQALKDGDEFAPYMPHYVEKVRSATSLVVKVLRLAGVSGACHRFRDTFASELLIHGAGLYEVCQFLGHSSVEITKDHYGNLLEEHKRLMGKLTCKLAYVLPLAG